jgi:hypothetical protein
MICYKGDLGVFIESWDCFLISQSWGYAVEKL